ncbi:hypothetical protein HAX54_038851 [Datura stramonium]|uniref:Uncharacterized protein n=1 Tax=Datura stramonium TaxID=4076 RepID=A0ABS8VKB3_DATST|nr:hypothetical protein [Datura stramonium]
MSKVKTDVQQLQPDLSIYDAPLPEDERVETDEEDLEDDHVTKELDEEATAMQSRIANRKNVKCEWATDQGIKLVIFVSPESQLKCGPRMANRGRGSTTNVVTWHSCNY